MKMKVFVLVACYSLCFVNFTQARFGVQLPFLDGHYYECLQNGNDTPSHDKPQTQYDLDFGMPRETLLVAASGGEVISVKDNCTEGDASCGHGFGNYVKIKNYNKDNSLLYAHLQYHGVIVSVGDHVDAGQPIGFSGNTGNSTGPHLHFGLHDDDSTRPGLSRSDVEIWSHDRNTDSDIWRLPDVNRRNSRAFSCRIAHKNEHGKWVVDEYGHNYQALDINGFLFSAFQCASVGNETIHCWRGEKDETGRYHMAWCDEAYYHIEYYHDKTGYHSEKLSPNDGWDMCNRHRDDVDLLAFLSNGYAVGGGEPDEDNTSFSNSHPTVKSCQVRINGETDFQHKVGKTLRPGNSFEIDIEAKIKNKGDEKSNNADLDYRIDWARNRFDTDDTNLGDDTIDIDPGETITEHKRNIKVKLSEDGTKITVSRNNRKESFQVNDGEAHFYIFLDVEDDNNHDISSETDHDEYAKVTVYVDDNQPPEGWLDEANCNQIRGWARDSNTTSPISVHFYADGEAGIGTFIGATPADQLRPDLPFDDKHHGFLFYTPKNLKDRLTHSIYAYGIDDQGGANPLLNGSPLIIQGCYQEVLEGSNPPSPPGDFMIIQ